MADTRHKLGLGTVQWGLAYGVANKGGKVAIEDIAALLDIAAGAGICVLDTAHAYGDAEETIGRLADRAAPFSVITKTKPVPPGDIDAAKVAEIAAAFDTSLHRLKGWCVDGVLVHDCDSLFRPGGERLWRFLSDQKTAGRVAKIGISVYGPEQARKAVESYGPDLIQVPFNIYDQRLLTSGTLTFLKTRGVEVHTRSAFLQGLLMMAPGDLPAYFAPIRDHHSRFHAALAAAGTTPLSAALQFCLAQPEVDRVILGCDSAAQLREILAAATATAAQPPASAFALHEEQFLNPSLWRLKA